MRSLARAMACVGVVLALTLSTALPAAAQGITTAAVRGQVVDDTGQPVEGATILLLNTSTGQRFLGTSRADGRYNIENVAVGGPYTIEARLIGYQTAQRTGLVLTLGQSLDLGLTMARAAVQLAAVVVTAEEQDPLTATSRTGTAAFVTDTFITRAPTLNRNFTDFIALVPQIAQIQGDAPSIGGGHNRMNNIQIDGVSDNDAFGLGSTGQPGSQVDAKSISLEAVKEYQVLIAPFDIRQGGFQGGLVNAITKRGTNEFSGSAFWYYQQDALVRDSLPANNVKFGQYLQHQRGFSVGGPILRDRVHFFGAAEWQTRESPSSGATIGRESPQDVQVAADSAQRLVDILQNVYGYDAGGYGALTIATPNMNAFGRLDVQLAENHVLTLRHNYVKATNDLGIFRDPASYEFSSNGYTIKNESNSSVLQLNSTLGGGKFYNELRIGYLRIRDVRDPLVNFAHLEVDTRSAIAGQSYSNTLYVGAERFSHRNRLDQDVWEFTDDLTFAKGGHTITVGTHNELLGFDNTYFHTSLGRWRFSTLADFEAGRPREYFAQVPYPSDPANYGSDGLCLPTAEDCVDRTTAGRADWSLTQLGGYVQDQWDVTRKLKLTIGLRLDVPIVNGSPKQNDSLAASATLAAAHGDSLTPINTGTLPSGNLHWAPRLGLNWDVLGNRATVVRGGVGIFTGRPAYVWLSNAFTNTAIDIATVTCSSLATIPVFNDSTLINAPQRCADGSFGAQTRAQVNYFEEDFHFPQQLKASLAVDQRLFAGIMGTVEFLYTKGMNTIYQQEMNIPRDSIRTNTEGRQLFGNSAAYSGGYIPPSRIDTRFAHVLRHYNRGQDRSYAVTLQLQKRFGQGVEFSAGYTYQNVKDITSLGSSVASSNYGFSPVSEGENPNQKSLTTSRFDVPHRFVLGGTVDLPLKFAPTSITLGYVRQSGTPYTWTINGDANGDGYPAAEIGSRYNDIVFVPNAEGSNFTAYNTNATNGDFAKYQALIDNPVVPNLMPCLKKVQDAGGGIPARNTCRNPSIQLVNASFRIGIGRALGGNLHQLTLVGDIFNLLNLLDSDWGVVRSISSFETTALIRLRGYDAANDRGQYEYTGPDVLTPVLDFDAGRITEAEAKRLIERNLKRPDNLLSRYRVQIGLRYDF